MFSFFTKIFFLLLSVILLIVVIPNPIHNQFPTWIKSYEDYKDPNSNKILDMDQLEIMNEDPLLCYKNSDCFLVLCGKTPNCHSLSLNKQYVENHKSKIPSKYQCPIEVELESDDCGKKPMLDLYATCQEGQCVIKHLLPTPTPSSSSIIEKALYQK